MNSLNVSRDLQAQSHFASTIQPLSALVDRMKFSEVFDNETGKVLPHVAKALAIAEMSAREHLELVCYREKVSVDAVLEIIERRLDLTRGKFATLFPTPADAQDDFRAITSELFDYGSSYGYRRFLMHDIDSDEVDELLLLLPKDSDTVKQGLVSTYLKSLKVLIKALVSFTAIKELIPTYREEAVARNETFRKLAKSKEELTENHWNLSNRISMSRQPTSKIEFTELRRAGARTVAVSDESLDNMGASNIEIGADALSFRTKKTLITDVRECSVEEIAAAAKKMKFKGNASEVRVYEITQGFALDTLALETSASQTHDFNTRLQKMKKNTIDLRGYFITVQETPTMHFQSVTLSIGRGLGSTTKRIVGEVMDNLTLSF
jgi:hypothetical protein